MEDTPMADGNKGPEFDFMSLISDYSPGCWILDEDGVFVGVGGVPTREHITERVNTMRRELWELLYFKYTGHRIRVVSAILVDEIPIDLKIVTGEVLQHPVGLAPYNRPEESEVSNGS